MPWSGSRSCQGAHSKALPHCDDLYPMQRRHLPPPVRVFHCRGYVSGRFGGHADIQHDRDSSLARFSLGVRCEVSLKICFVQCFFCSTMHRRSRQSLTDSNAPTSLLSLPQGPSGTFSRPLDDPPCSSSPPMSDASPQSTSRTVRHTRSKGGCDTCRQQKKKVSAWG